MLVGAPERTDTSSGRGPAPECPAGGGLEVGDRVRKRGQHVGGDRAALVVIAAALVGRDRERRRHRDLVPEHLGDAPRLPAELLTPEIELAAEGDDRHHSALPDSASASRDRPASEISSSWSSNQTVW